MEFGLVESGFKDVSPKGDHVMRGFGRVAVLGADSQPTGETLRLDPKGARFALCDEDREDVNLLSVKSSEALLGIDLTPLDPEPGTEIIFTRVGDTAAYWAIASQWREQIARIGTSSLPPLYDE